MVSNECLMWCAINIIHYKNMFTYTITSQEEITLIMTLQVILILKIWISIFYIFLNWPHICDKKWKENERRARGEKKGQENEKEEHRDLWR